MKDKLPININLEDRFFNAEEKCGYMVSSDMKKVWAVLLDLLNEFRRVCEKHSLRWWVTAGTLLGTIRHQGFIPWDDDIDVMMPREDFDKFVEISKSEFSYPYFLQNEYSDPGSNRFHSKLRNSATTGITKYEAHYGFKCNLGIALGIFPLDNIPNDRKEQLTFIGEIEELMNIEEKCIHEIYYWKPKYGRGFIKWFKHLVKHILYNPLWNKKYDYRMHYEKIQELIRKYDVKPSSDVALLVLHPSERFLWKRNWMSSTIYMHFENMQVPVPIGYIALLDKLYGNWHEPIIGTSVHGDAFYDAEKPYSEYINKMSELW